MNVLAHLQEGLTCREAAAPCCHFCGVRMPEALDLSIAGLSNRELLNEAQELGADAKWCLERSELVAVYKRARQVICRECAGAFLPAGWMQQSLVCSWV